MYAPIQNPFSNTFQNNLWVTKGARGGPNAGPRRSAPAELAFREQQNGRWTQGGRRCSRARASLYMVRPCDGKRAGFFGRVKDSLTGEGPDIFITKCGDKRVLMRDRPQRWQWSGWRLTGAEAQDLADFDMDFRKKDLAPAENWLPSVAAARGYRPFYDFKTRKYESNFDLKQRPKASWRTDARWKDGARRSDMRPLSYRDGECQWMSRVPASSGNFPGGRPRRPRV